ncbi:unnamed protein product [Effrenium voratum]|nr:unnamed protein product [Effrenium voratum]
MNKHRGKGQGLVKSARSPSVSRRALVAEPINSESRESFVCFGGSEPVKADPRGNDSLCHSLGARFTSSSSLRDNFRWHGQRSVPVLVRAQDNLGLSLPAFGTGNSSYRADFGWPGKRPKRSLPGR